VLHRHLLTDSATPKSNPVDMMHQSVHYMQRCGSACRPFAAAKRFWHTPAAAGQASVSTDAAQKKRVVFLGTPEVRIEESKGMLTD
jgi:hypothetical protein